MFSKVIVSASVVFLLFTGAARAASSDAEFSAAESASPDSVDYPNRMQGRAPTDEEIERLESGNPDSVRYGERMIDGTEITARGWSVLESGNPDYR
jgi:hypothetical protein